MYRPRLRQFLLAALIAMIAVSQAPGLSGHPHAVFDAALPAPSVHVQANQIVDASGHTLRLLGVNRSGTEYMCSIGKDIFDGPSDATSVQAIAAWHTNAVRVPLNEDCWLGINGVNPAYAGVTYQQAIANYVSLLNQNGLVAILDLASSAPGTTLATDQQQPMPDQDHSVAFWSQVATIYKSNGAVIFDLFNEAFPDSNQDTTAAWVCLRDGSPCPGVSYVAAGMQTLVNTVRGVGASNVLLVGGVTFSGHLSQWLQYKPVDPLNNIAASWHSYNFSQCRDQTCWDNEVAPLARQVPIIVGELGEDDCASVYTDRLIAWMDAHALSYLA